MLSSKWSEVRIESCESKSLELVETKLKASCCNGYFCVWVYIIIKKMQYWINMSLVWNQQENDIKLLLFKSQ